MREIFNWLFQRKVYVVFGNGTGVVYGVYSKKTDAMTVLKNTRSAYMAELKLRNRPTSLLTEEVKE